MKLTSFHIKDYRSIRSAKLKNLHESVSLVGPNNEGKSNVLLGLNACLSVLQSRRSMKRDGCLMLYPTRKVYDWQADYPVELQQSVSDGRTVFELEFELTEKEQKKAHKVIGNKFNHSMSVELSFSSDFAVQFRVTKKRRANSAILKNAEKLCQFIADHLDFILGRSRFFGPAECNFRGVFTTTPK
jgi:AAA15 family ATPase/GTPase